jgi:hypothetical protein
MSRPADAAARSSIRAKPAVVNGAPRSETNMNGDGGASRWKRRSVLISRPVRGWVLGVPTRALVLQPSSNFSTQPINEAFR